MDSRREFPFKHGTDSITDRLAGCIFIYLKGTNVYIIKLKGLNHLNKFHVTYQDFNSDYICK